MLPFALHLLDIKDIRDRKSTRLNSSHSQISYAVFCLKKKKTMHNLRGSTVFDNTLVSLRLHAVNRIMFDDLPMLPHSILTAVPMLVSKQLPTSPATHT